jgi:exosortase O
MALEARRSPGCRALPDINTLSATLFGLATYGLLGLWLEPQRWRRGLPAALLLVGVLPFGEHLQTFVGYPVRILTAALVQKGLAAAGAHSVGMETILVFENGVSQVDIPCSGVKSLWTGPVLAGGYLIEDTPDPSALDGGSPGFWGSLALVNLVGGECWRRWGW